MSMSKLGRVTVALVLVLGVGATLAAQEKKKPAAPPDEKAMMEAWEKAMTPGEMHQKLQPFVGNFDCRVRSWMDPNKPPEDSAGTSEAKWIFGDRFIEQTFEGSMMGQAFNGLGYTGYDNVKKKYVGTWMDSMGTGIYINSGTVDASGKIWTFKGNMDDPLTGKAISVDQKLTLTDNDHHTFEMWMAGPDGKKFKTLEIEYSRKK